jgi:hypothetical protein
MRLRNVACCASGLVLLGALPTAAHQDPRSSDLNAAIAAIERPQIAGEIDSPEVLTVGNAEIRPSAGARVLLLSADARICGVLIDGAASLTYRVKDRLSIPLARRNAGRIRGLAARETADEITLSGALQGAAVWGWQLDVAARTPRPAPSASLPAWLGELLENKLEANPGRDMLLSSANGDAGYRWAALHTGADDFILDVDPRPAVRLESFLRARRLSRNAGALGGRLTADQIVPQPIAKPWWQPAAIDFASVDSDIDVRHESGNHVAIRARTRYQSRREGLRVLSLALLSEAGLASGHRRAFKISSLTVDGAPAPYAHWRDNLLVLLPRALNKNDATVVETTAGGEILEQPEGDTYWQLGGEPWYPRPEVGGIEEAAFRIAVQTNAPFVPFAGGDVIRRETEGQARKVVTRLNGPMDRVHVLAGKYFTVTDEDNGARVHVSTYGSARKDDASRVAKIVHGVRGCLTTLLGVPYPFQDLQIVEINQWGWGQAPPGMIFVTREAFLTRARAGALDEESVFIAQQVSQGINERVAHEVAHAWFPHVAKVDRAEENWLSESLADYMSAVCLEQIDDRSGKARFNRQLAEWKYLAGQIGSGASVYLAAHLGAEDADWRDWRALLYARGPLVLHAVRQELARTAATPQEGDRLFFAWMRSYIRNFTFKTGETRHLVGILNQITKRDWQSWFERYVYGTETPPAR